MSPRGTPDERLPLVYPLCRGVPKGHPMASCVHCQNFIRSYGPQLQSLIRLVNRLVQRIDKLEERGDVTPTNAPRRERARRSS